jgi:hypothetical protein
LKAESKSDYPSKIHGFIQCICMVYIKKRKKERYTFNKNEMNELGRSL